MSEEIRTDELCHYGRKGMKWYQNIYSAHKKKSIAKKRLKNLQKARDVRAEKKRQADERQEKINSGKISVKKMTTAELNERIKRLQLEKTYKDLEKSSVSKGRAIFDDIVEASTKNIGTQLATYVLGTGVNKAAEIAGIKNATKTIKDKNGVETVVKYFDDIVNPKKGQKDK